jgi:NAD+ synthase (glutamine-hydrolysing)
MQDSEQRVFDSIYTHGFARVPVAMPAVDVAAPEFNTDQTLRLARQAASGKAVLAIFPELGLSAYSLDEGTR